MIFTDQERRALNELISQEYSAFKNVAESYLSETEIEALKEKLSGN